MHRIVFYNFLMLNEKGHTISNHASHFRLWHEKITVFLTNYQMKSGRRK